MSPRVLFYSIVDPRQPGGVELFLSRLIARVRAEGWPAVELRAAPPARPGAEVCPLHVRPDPRRRHHVPSLLRLGRILLRHRPAVVNIHFITAQALCFFALRRFFGYRIVLSAHGSDVMLPDEQTRPLLAHLLSRADAITVVSASLRGRVLAHDGVDPARVHLIPNGVDCDFWSPAADGPKGGARLIAVGRLERVKGVDVLIDAFARLAEQHPDARLTIVGDGGERAALERQAATLGLSDRIAFLGTMDAAGVRQCYRQANLFVLPSRSEGLPLALLEAMACALPAVAARVGGVGEVMTPATGLMVPPEDPPALAAALSDMLDDPARLRAAGRAARQRAGFFSSISAERAYIDLLQAISGATGDRGRLGAVSGAEGAAGRKRPAEQHVR